MPSLESFGESVGQKWGKLTNKESTGGRVTLHQREIVDDLDQLLEILPTSIRLYLEEHDNLHDLIEIVLDLGRVPEARFIKTRAKLGSRAVTVEDLRHVLDRVGQFGPDNRAGIERTLHRISAIRNRNGDIIGITCRIGRAVYGTLGAVRDIVELDRNVLFLGRPGIGKTTMLREFARVLADDLEKRVVVVDTSNEIAGDGDIPHPAIGDARRMQVPRGVRQADVMIEAVENHMPEVIVIDEIGTADEANAARTIAERGVRLIGTAHGNTLENLVLNPTLADLVGGIQAVTLGDEEARKRGSQKTVLERKAPPTFDVLIEIQEKNQFGLYHEVGAAVDSFLRGAELRPEVRRRESDGGVTVVDKGIKDPLPQIDSRMATNGNAAVMHRMEIPFVERSLPRVIRIFPYAVSRNRLERAIRESRAPVHVTKNLHEADLVLTLKGQYRKMPKRLKDAEKKGLPIRLIRSNTLHQIRSFLDELSGGGDTSEALVEAERAVHQVRTRYQPVELSPRTAPLRKLQHDLVQRYHLRSQSVGHGGDRRVVVFPQDFDSGEGEVV